MAKSLALLALSASITLVATQNTCPDGSLPANQRIEWTSCPLDSYAPLETGQQYRYTVPNLQCGTIDVPFDYTDSKSRTLRIPLVRIPPNGSQTAVNKTLIYNPGGPGASAIESLLGSFKTYHTLTGNLYNLLAFDPRGVGQTIPYTCPYTTKLFPGRGLPLSNPRGVNATFYSYTDQGEVCNRQPYQDAGEVISTAFTARDVDAIFQALGEDGKIRYWGFSYGTALGDTIAAMFPDKIDRMVLDGNWNPTEYYHGAKDENVANVDSLVGFFFDQCFDAGIDYCDLADLSTSGKGLEADFINVMAQLENGSLVPSFNLAPGVPATYKTIKNNLFQSFYQARKFGAISSAIYEIYLELGLLKTRPNKRQSAARFNVTEFFGIRADKVQNSLNLPAISCGESDYVINGTLSDFQAIVRKHQLRSRFGGDLFVSNALSCAGWDTRAKEAYTGKFTGIQTLNPILYVNGDKDPVTPDVSAKNASSGFTGSGLLRHTGAGHCSSSHPSNCVQEKVLSYWQTGVIPSVSEICQPNVPNPFTGDVRSPVNITDNNVINGTSSITEIEAFNQAVADFGRDGHIGRTEYLAPTTGFVFPEELMKRGNPSKVKRQSASASCVAINAVPTTSTKSSSSGNGGSGGGSSSSSTQGAASQIAVGGVALFVTVTASLGFLLI